MLRRFVPRATFSHPKSIYAVEDALRFYLTNKPQAKVLDIYAGSGSTAHAVMLLNATDGGARESTSVTINELSPHMLRHLALAGLDGDENDPTGVFYAVLVPRLKAALTGLTPSGDPVKGKYCFPDRTACSEGLPGQLAVMTRQVVRQAQAA